MLTAVMSEGVLALLLLLLLLVTERQTETQRGQIKVQSYVRLVHSRYEIMRYLSEVSIYLTNCGESTDLCSLEYISITDSDSQVGAELTEKLENSVTTLLDLHREKRIFFTVGGPKSRPSLQAV